MSAATSAANRWLGGNIERVDGATVSIVEGGVAVGRHTGVAHHVLEAAEITIDGVTTLAARWLCGSKSVDAVMLPDGSAPVCVGCRLTAAVPQCPVVYFAWGEGDDNLLYVGSSIKVAQRIRSHDMGTPWWPEVRRLTFLECKTELEARREEAAAIAERPGQYNRRGRTDRPTPLSLLDGIEVGIQ